MFATTNISSKLFAPVFTIDYSNGLITPRSEIRVHTDLPLSFPNFCLYTCTPLAFHMFFHPPTITCLRTYHLNLLCTTSLPTRFHEWCRVNYS